MTTEVWFRNPDNYILELIEVGESNIVWDRGYLVKKKIDAAKHAELYFGNASPHRILLVGTQGTAELRAGDTLMKPSAVYPTWAYGEDLALLEEFIEKPAGKDMVACNDRTVPGDERPVWGQEHRVVVTDLPPVSTGPGRRFLTTLKTLQEDYPECIIHVHGLYSYRGAFGMGFASADIEPRTVAQKGKVTLPSGNEVRFEVAQSNANWITVVGFKPAELSVPRVRCMFNIKSALWAGKHYDEIFNFKTTRDKTPVDITSSDEDHEPQTNNRVMMKNGTVAKDGDKVLCDTCSLQTDCKYFRTGAVCTVPDAEPNELAKMFKTRDSQLIIDGLGTLVAANTRRLERGMKEEEAFGDVNPEVTRMLGQVFDQGIKLAKLVDPALRGGAKVQVNVGAGGAAAISGADPRQLIASAVRALELEGIPRDQITQEMIQGLLSGMANPNHAQRAIEGQVIAKRDEAS